MKILFIIQYVLLHLIEEWKTILDNNFVVDAVLLDLSKASDCILHDLLTVRLTGYRFEEETLLYIYSFLENRKQCIKSNSINSNFFKLPQGSIVDPIFLNIFFNNFLFFLCVMCLFIILPMIIPHQVLPRPRII